MHISILGPLEVRSDSGVLSQPAGAKQRLLLAALLLHYPRAAPAPRLIEMLWGDDLPRDAAGALRTQISRLRSFLADACAGKRAGEHVGKHAGTRAGTRTGEDAADAETIVSGPDGYRLCDGLFDVDAERFVALLQRSRTAADPRAEVALLDEALALWHGEPYEEFADYEPFLGAIRSLAEHRTTALERRAECLIALGACADAVAALDPLVRADPMRERPRALLMQALYQAGRMHEALSVFQEYRRLLSHELGLDPSPAMRQLEARLLRHEAPAQPPPGLLDTQPALADDSQQIRFTRARDGVRLAYATVGSGPPLIKAANWLNHLEFDWESPVWRRLLRTLAANHTFIRYDERGSGLSDRDVADLSLEAWVLDLEAIVEASGYQRFPLLGISQGCAVCIEYAARHPERVSGLILHGGYAAGWRADPSYGEAEIRRRDASIEIVRHGWGEDTPAYRQMFTQTFIPGGTAEEIEWFNELQRRTVSPDNAARFMEAFATIDVRDRLASVTAPTLVLHSRGDQRIHFEKGRELAMGIPNARFVLLDSENHLILEHEPAFDHWVDEAQRFLATEALPAERRERRRSTSGPGIDAS